METLAPTWDLGHATTAKWYVRLFPSLSDVAFLLPIVALFTKFRGTELLFADGDTGWHIRTGEWILEHRAIPTTDIFSFTKPHQAWFAWEWGWDVAFAVLHRCAGLSGVGFVTALMLGIFTLLVYRLALRASGNHLMSIAVTALAAGASSIHWLARPHLVSWIFTLIFLNAIFSAQLGRRRMLYFLPVLMMFWVNLHGGFIAGLMVLGCYAIGEALTSLTENKTPEKNYGLSLAWRRSAPYWISLALTTAATLVNPYGWQLHRHIFNYLTDADMLNRIQEFQSISFHAGPASLFEIMLLLAAFVIFAKLKTRQFSPILLICLWAHLALLSARHIPLFTIAAAPFVAALLASALERAHEIPVLTAFPEMLTDICRELRAVEVNPRLHLTSAGALLVVAGLFASGQAPFKPEFSADVFPASAIPVLERHAGSRVFTTDQWGDYLLYRMYPAQRVFFDGRSDFYGNDFVKTFQRIALAEHDWKSLLQRYAINLVVLKPEMPLSAVLKLTPGSKVLFDDGKVIVFDTNGIYRPILGKRDTANRAASFPGTPQPIHSGLAVTANRPA